MNTQTMGMMIASLRKTKQMTQAELAELMGVTDKAVSKWERDLSLPDLNSIPKLAKIFDISVDDLIQRNCPQSTDSRRPVHRMVMLVLRAVALAMGISVAVLSVLKAIDLRTGFFLLGLGLTCAGIYLLQNEGDRN